MGRRKRGRVTKAERRRRARSALDELRPTLTQPWAVPQSDTVCAAAKTAWQIARRHRVSLDPAVKSWICRGCHNLLRPGLNARVRIRGGCRSTTCADCARVARSGPDFGRNER